MIAVFAITDRTDGEDDMHIGILLAKEIDGLLKIVGTLIYRQIFFIKQGSGAFLTIIDNLTRFLQAIDMIGAQSKEDCRELWILISEEFLNGMEDGGWIVHYAEGIHHSTELLLLEALPYLSSEARSYEENLLAWAYLKARLLNIYNRPELHNYKLSTVNYKL